MPAAKGNARTPLGPINILNVVKVFRPAGDTESDRLYAQFDSLRTARLVYRYVKNLRNRDHKVTMYVPHSHYDQFCALSEAAYQYRNGPDKLKTRICFGRKNMYLKVKPEQSVFWTVVNVPNLPNILLTKPPLSTVLSSPTLGRQRESATPKRSAEDSPTSSRDSKLARNMSPKGDSKEDTESIEKAGQDTTAVGGQSLN